MRNEKTLGRRFINHLCETWHNKVLAISLIILSILYMRIETFETTDITCLILIGIFTIGLLLAKNDVMKSED